MADKWEEIFYPHLASAVQNSGRGGKGFLLWLLKVLRGPEFAAFSNSVLMRQSFPRGCHALLTGPCHPWGTEALITHQVLWIFVGVSGFFHLQSLLTSCRRVAINFPQRAASNMWHYGIGSQMHGPIWCEIILRYVFCPGFSLRELNSSHPVQYLGKHSRFLLPVGNTFQAPQWLPKTLYNSGLYGSFPSKFL